MRVRDIIIQRDSLSLGVTLKEDIEYLANLFGDIELMRYTFGKIFSKEEAINYIKSNFNFNSNIGFSPILLDNRVIGFGGLFKFSANSYELGYILDKAYWGRGLATKAALMQRDYIVNTLKSKALATTHPQNFASRRVLAKCGFEYVKDIVMEYRGERKLFEYKKLERV